MHTTTKGMLINYISTIKKCGHIQNGGRNYHARRSQPPMIIPMMKSFVDSTNHKQFVEENIGVLEKEFNYWITYHIIKIEKNGKNYTLAIYKDSSTEPTPESYREGNNEGQTLKTESDKDNFYSQLKAVAES